MNKNFFLALMIFCDLFGNIQAQSPNFLWAKGIGGGTLYKSSTSIAIDANGSVYTSGYFSDTVDFDPGPGVYNLNSLEIRSFISKLDINGNFQWVKVFESTGFSAVSSIILDDSGNVFTTGSFQGTADFDPGPGTYFLGPGSNNFFISKLDSSGNFVWAKAINSTLGNSISGNFLQLDSNKNLYITGVFHGIVDFDPDSIVQNNLASNGSQDVFVTKFDHLGNFTWAKQIGGLNTSVVSSNWLSIDDSNNVYVTGSFTDTIDFDPGIGIVNLSSTGAEDIFIFKLDSSGNFDWAKAFGGNFNDESGYSLTIDMSNNIYITGAFFGTIDFDPDSGTFNLTSSGGMDAFISKFDALGNFIWAKAIGGLDWDKGIAITTDLSGNIYTTGEFGDNVDFDPGSGIFNLTATSRPELFITKWDASGNFAWAKACSGSNGYNDLVKSMSINSFGDIVLTGYFNGAYMTFDSLTIFNLHPNAQEIFIAKIDTSSIISTIKDLNFSNVEFSLFPNPASDKFYISTDFHNKFEVTIYDISGKIIYEAIRNPGEIFEIISNFYSNGIYFVKIKENDFTQFKKLVIYK
jgi:hypothetical protein